MMTKQALIKKNMLAHIKWHMEINTHALIERTINDCETVKNIVEVHKGKTVSEVRQSSAFNQLTSLFMGPITNEMENAIPDARALDYYIYSIEHHGFWKPKRCGYTHDIDQAGIYDFATASEICRQANIVEVNELMMCAIHINPTTGQPEGGRVEQ